MSPEIEQLNNRITYLEGIIASLVKSDRYIIAKTLQFNDGRNVQFGRSTGTMFGTATDQKIGFWGKAPVGVQAGGAGSAGVTWTGTEQAMLNYAYTALRNLGILQ